MPEKFPSSESVNRQELIEALRTKGIKDPETRELLQKWAEAKEAEVMAKNNAEASDNVRAAIEFERERAKLYFEAGYINEALDTLEDARLQAHQIGDQELYNTIMAEMDKIEEESAEKK